MSSDRESDTSSILYLCKDIQHYLRSFVPCRDTIGLALTNKMMYIYGYCPMVSVFGEPMCSIHSNKA